MPEPLVGQVSAVEVQPLEQEHPAEVGQPDAGKPVTRQVEFFEPGQLAEVGEVGVLNLTPRQDEGL